MAHFGKRQDICIPVYGGYTLTMQTSIHPFFLTACRLKGHGSAGTQIKWQREHVVHSIVINELVISDIYIVFLNTATLLAAE